MHSPVVLMEKHNLFLQSDSQFRAELSPLQSELRLEESQSTKVCWFDVDWRQNAAVTAPLRRFTCQKEEMLNTINVFVKKKKSFL